jgi:phosphatidylglycerophosphate synthase
MTIIMQPLRRTQRSGTPSTTALLSAFTALRLVLVPPIIASFMVSPLVTTVCLGLFMAADLYDGVLARRLNADGLQRRAFDSTVDRIAIDVCLVAAYLAHAMPAILLAGFLARDLYCALLCAWMVRLRGVALKVDVVYRSLSFFIATWAIAAPFLSATARTDAAGILLIAATAVAVDLTHCVRRVIAAGDLAPGRTISVGLLRRDHRAQRRARHAAEGSVRDTAVIRPTLAR